MKIRWALLLGLCLCGLQVQAEESVVIDSRSVTDPSASSNAVTNTTAPSESQAEADAARKDQVLKGGRISPRERAALAKAALAETNQQEGANFLASHRAQKGVITLSSGVQYKVLRAGNGKMPTEDSVVRCRYKGKLIDGTSVDKTDEKKPASLRVAGFLAGLKEAVKLMSTGSKWEIVIPPEQAYGSQGNRGVGPNAVLIYEMEILGIK